MNCKIFSFEYETFGIVLSLFIEGEMSCLERNTHRKEVNPSKKIQY